MTEMQYNSQMAKLAAMGRKVQIKQRQLEIEKSTLPISTYNSRKMQLDKEFRMLEEMARKVKLEYTKRIR